MGAKGKQCRRTFCLQRHPGSSGRDAEKRTVLAPRARVSVFPCGRPRPRSRRVPGNKSPKHEGVGAAQLTALLTCHLTSTCGCSQCSGVTHGPAESPALLGELCKPHVWASPWGRKSLSAHPVTSELKRMVPSVRLDAGCLRGGSSPGTTPSWPSGSRKGTQNSF